MSTRAHVEDYSPGEHGLPHMGEVIADHRIKAGWTSQDTFAIVCGVDKQSVIYWENQKYLSDMTRRIFLCKLLKIPPDLLGLTWPSLLSDKQVQYYINDAEYQAKLLEENSYGLYEDILSFARVSPDKYSRETVYRFYKHQRELETITKYASSFAKDGWKDLLCRYYQHSTFIAQHHAQDTLALSYANQACNMASSLEQEDVELMGSSYYKRARIYVTQGTYDLAREDIQEALMKTERARLALKGSTYLLAAEINSLYASDEGELRSQCRRWQDDAANLLYKRKTESDTTFVVFNLYSVHHERAKTLTRFSLFHTTDDELIERLKDTYVKADVQLIKDAHSALMGARKHLSSAHNASVMDCAITEARLLLVEREYEESAKVAKNALNFAKILHSSKGVNEVGKIHTILYELVPQNPYVCNLGVELGRF